jgi:signal transduction histidine kinase
MKKRILSGVIAFTLIFLATSAYIITRIEHATTRMDNLIMLHQVEILREHLLIQLKRAQSDLTLKDTRHARSIDTIVTHVRQLDAVVRTCFGCHHEDSLQEILDSLRQQSEQYKIALSRVFTVRANAARRAAEEENAFRIGSNLIEEVHGITALTSMKLEQRTQQAFREIGRTKVVLYALLGAVPLVALALSVVVLTSFTKPVTALLTATRRLKGGDLDYRITGLTDEYGEVGASFNEMAASLKQHCVKMQWAEQLVVLGELAGGLAHEIKNPLAGIRTTVEVLANDRAMASEHKDVLAKIIETIDRIDVLIKNLLNFARPPQPHFMLADLNAVVDGAVSLAQRHPLFKTRDDSVTIGKDYAENLQRLLADPLQLQQVILNLLLNAAEAMPGGGTVTARTFTDNGVLGVSIGDTGHGIGDQLMARIFQPFFTTKAKGTGLGLAISKRLVEQHGGSIKAENMPSGGASFVITLPVEPRSVNAEKAP